eukprot:gene6269-6507_t
MVVKDVVTIIDDRDDGAAMYSLYNTIQPELPVGLATHPLRQLLDQYLDPSFLLQFHAALFSGAVPAPPFPVTVEWLLRLLKMYANSSGPLGREATFHSTKPDQMLEHSGLSAHKFTRIVGNRPSQAWDLYPVASLNLKIAQQTKAYAAAALEQLYPSDDSVNADTALQAWVAAMLDPWGGNMIQISSDNTILTREALFEFVGSLLYRVILHNTANVQDFAMLKLSLAQHPTSMAISNLPNPTATYSVKAMVQGMTNTNIYSRAMSSTYVFEGAAPITQFVPGYLNYSSGQTAPQWQTSLPFAQGASAAGDAANEATVEFRKDIAAMLKSFPRSSLKVTNTNWGMPLIMPRAISL